MYVVICYSNPMKDCVFCEINTSIDEARRLYQYDHWELILQQPHKLQQTKQSAGLLVSHRHVPNVTDLDDAEIIELRDSIKDASKRLCDATGTTYTGQETVGFNQGEQAGQTLFHAHVHVLPVAQEDPDEMKKRGGIGGAFEALRKERMKV